MPLRVIRSEPLEGGYNMALDAMLARGVAASGEPVLRLYRWSEATASVGRGISVSHALGAAICYPGVTLVRRPTGGGIVYHADQMSFALAWPRGAVESLVGLRASYCSIHKAVQAALSECGYATHQVTREQEDVGVLCSSTRVEGDLMGVEGSKVLGGAQWRLSGSVLYQGHLWIRWMPSLEEEVVYHIGQLVGAPTQMSDTTPEEHRAASESSEQFLLRRAEAG